ncbi:MAG: hypothetical protein K2G38_06500 [Clostridia bacterium]|nr:hypothetical protein [Clostridia bacterium]
MPSWILFNKYECYPNLLKMHKKYRKMRAVVIRYSVKTSVDAGNKMDKACNDLDAYVRTEYSKAVYDIFNPIKPNLLNRRRGGEFLWDEVFDKPFEELTYEQKDYLVGLIEHDFVYELPPEYYETPPKYSPPPKNT